MQADCIIVKKLNFIVLGKNEFLRKTVVLKTVFSKTRKISRKKVIISCTKNVVFEDENQFFTENLIISWEKLINFL